MGIVGLWSILSGNRDAKITADDVYVDGWYMVIRVATAMQKVAEEHRELVVSRTIIARKRFLESIQRNGSIIVVFDGEGTSAKKLPRGPVAASNEVISSVITAFRTILGDIASFINLSPGIEADEYIAHSASSSDVIVSDDSDMLLVGATVIRFDGTIYTPDSVLDDISAAVGRKITIDALRVAAAVAGSDKKTGRSILTILRYD